MKKNSGEIATVLAIGTMIVIAISTFVSSNYLKNKQTTTTKAQEIGPQVTCQHNPWKEKSPTNYCWFTDCKKLCVTNADCPMSPSGYVRPETSNWCYAFLENGQATKRCMMLVYKDDANYAECNKGGVPSTGGTGVGTVPGTAVGSGTTPGANTPALTKATVTITLTPTPTTTSATNPLCTEKCLQSNNMVDFPTNGDYDTGSLCLDNQVFKKFNSFCLSSNKETRVCCEITSGNTSTPSPTPSPSKAPAAGETKQCKNINGASTSVVIDYGKTACVTKTRVGKTIQVFIKCSDKGETEEENCSGECDNNTGCIKREVFCPNFSLPQFHEKAIEVLTIGLNSQRRDLGQEINNALYNKKDDILSASKFSQELKDNLKKEMYTQAISQIPKTFNQIISSGTVSLVILIDGKIPIILPFPQVVTPIGITFSITGSNLVVASLTAYINNLVNSTNICPTN